MTLKETFRYQNFIKQMMRAAELFLADPSNLVTITKSHQMKAANPDAEDKIETVAPETEYTAADVLDFAASLVDERVALTKAINKAKAHAILDLDALIEGNKMRQSVVGLFRRVIQKGKPTESVSRGVSYKFNVEGNQAQYYYDIVSKSQPTFDPAKLMRIVSDMSSEAERVSVSADALRVNTEVDFSPRYNVTLTFDEIMSQIAAKKPEKI